VRRSPVGTVGLAVQALRLVAGASPRGFLLAVGWQVAGAAAAVALVLSARATLESVLRPAVTSRDVLPPLVVLALASTLGSAVTGWQNQQLRILGEDAATFAWSRLLSVISRVDLRTTESPEFVDRVERIQEHALGRPVQVADSLLGLVGSAVSVVTLSAAVLALHPALLPLLLLAGGPAVVLSRIASRREFAHYRRHGELLRRRGYLREILTHQDFAQEVRAYGIQGEVENRHWKLSSEYRGRLVAHVHTRQLIALAEAAVSAVALSASLGLIAWLIASDRISLARAGAAVIAVRLLAGQIERFFQSVGSVVEAAPFVADLQDLLESTPVPADSPRDTWPLTVGLRLSGIRFRYTPEGAETLRGVDLEIAPGEVVALVGENGSGKTTLAKIVSGLYAPSAGSVSWDGHPVDDASRHCLRRSVATLFQDFVDYDLTAADNIELNPDDPEADPGCRRAERRRVELAAERAAIADRLRALPDGFDTMLGRQFTGGQELSGGQWQRLALARALVRDSPIVVLDEPASALDPRAEHELLSDLRRALSGRAVLLISHRYGNLHLADRIYVLQDGAVVDNGRHNELIARNGLYAELYRLQAQRYR
jgi:ATP-binding cassette subfamily B protein